MKRTYAALFSLLVALLGASSATAQDLLPQGHPPVEAAPPAEELPAGHPPVPAESAPTEPLPSGHPPVAAEQVADVMREPTPAVATPSAELAAGTIRVLVVDENNQPVRDTPVDLGVMASGGERSRHNARTNADGIAAFRRLPVGTDQAYRVNVPYRGATYSSTPFQLESDRGHDVRVVRYPVTRDDQYVFFNRYRVIMEIIEERLKVVHHAELTNAGRDTYVFPSSGVRVPLPETAVAFQAQAVMTDQHVEEVSGRHSYAIRGSLPRGTVRLAWTYDIPLDDDELRIPFGIPMRSFEVEVFTQAAEDLQMEVTGMPDPQRIDNEGVAFWGTGLRRRPTDARLDRITVILSDIPGPGPLRWLAVLVAIVFLGLGIFLMISRADDRGSVVEARRRRRDALLAEAHELEKDHAAGDVGPEYRQKRRAEIVRELAVLLHEEEVANRASQPVSSGAQPAR